MNKPDKVARARGRARARSRGAHQEQDPVPGRQDSRPQQGPRAGGSGVRPGSARQQTAPAPTPGTSRGNAGRASTYRSAAGVQQITQEMERAGLGAEAAETSIGRGSMRGRRSMKAEVLRTRPDHVEDKKGSSGNTVKLTANYFPVLATINWCLLQYRVDFVPEEDNTLVRKSLVRDHRARLGGYMFDGTVMFTTHLLSQDRAQPIELCSQRRSDDAKIIISIRLVGDVMPTDFTYLQFYNILMRSCLQKLRLQLVSRNYFDAHAKVSVPEYKLELWPGYITSIRQHETSILMCAEITHKVMRQDTVLDLVTEIARKGGEFQRIFKAAVMGSIVLTDYNNRTYRVDDVDFRSSPSDTFKLKNGDDISYLEYYRQKYSIGIRDANQPLLISRSKARDRRAGQPELVFLVPELCRMTGLNDNMRSDFSLMRALSEHTRVGPQKRIEKLLAFSKRLLQQEDVVQEMGDWDLKLSRELVKFDGRVLPAENIIQARNNKYAPSQPVDWTKELRSAAMLTQPALRKWAVLCPGKMMRDAQAFVGTLQRSASGMRFVIPHPEFFDIQDDRASTYVEHLERIINRLNPQLIMCCVPNNRADRYAAIKKKCCVERAVPTQVIVNKSMVSKGVMSIATKVAIQMNCKIGGAPWAVDIPLNGLMVVGFDVCHDTANRQNSYGAMVASLDKPLTRYYSAVSAHTSGEELSDYLSINLIKALRKYMVYNEGALPGRIIIYRDGVGEGQLEYVYDHEVKLVLAKLKSFYAQANAAPKLAFIVVTKRINTRIFLEGGNPPSGTLVDDTITMPLKYDFFLVSQSVRQGTVSPTAYNVLHDSIDLEPDKIQRLTYKLTHLYYNWSGTVRVPAPCQYAHKLAFLVGQSLHRSPNPQLEDTLFFL